MRNWQGIEPQEIWIFALVGTYLLIILGPARSHNWDRREYFWASTFGLVGALWGGHLLVLLSQPTMILEDPLRLLNFLQGGKGVFGAFIGAALGGGLYLLFRRQPVLTYADAAVPAIAFGYAVARIGCFLNGCCFGILSDVPWAVRFPYGTEAFENHFTQGWVRMEDHVCLPVHPTQLYHAAAGLVIFLILMRWRPRSPGSRTAFAMAGYGAARFFLQFVRGDTTSVLCFLDISQMISLILCISGCFMFYRLKKQAQSREQVFSPQGKPASHSLVSH